MRNAIILKYIITCLNTFLILHVYAVQLARYVLYKTI